MNAIFGPWAVCMNALNFVAEYFLVVYFFRPLEDRRERGRLAGGYLCLALLALLYFGSPGYGVGMGVSFSRFADLFIREVCYYIPVYGYLRLSKTAGRPQCVYLALYYLFFYETAYIYRHTVSHLASVSSHGIALALAGFLGVLAVEFLFAWLVHSRVPLERIVNITPFRMFFVLALNLVSLYLKYAMMVQQSEAQDGMVWGSILYPLIAGLSMEFIMALFESYQASEEERKALQLQKEMRTYELADAEMTAEANQNIRQIYHDMKNHMLAIRTMGGEEGQVSDYIDSILDHMEVYEELVKTGLPYLDAYLSQKVAALKGDGVQCHISLSLGGLSYIAPVDMISVIGNGVDNAGEALKKLPREERVLSVKSSVFANLMVLQFINPFDGELRRQNGRLVTLKQNREEHGIGLRTIQKVADKYGGSVDVEADEEKRQFHLRVMIPTQENTKQ